MKTFFPDDFKKYPVCVVDHINHEKTDLTLNNLRIVNPLANSRNRKAKNNYVGVSYSKEREKYASQISYRKKTIGLGRYICEIFAAIAYDLKSYEYYGNYRNFDNLSNFVFEQNKLSFVHNEEYHFLNNKKYSDI